MRAARAAQWGLSVAAVLWVAALVAKPEWLFALGAFICHQRPERSFFFGGHQLPVCGRCLGLYVGSAIASPVALSAASSLAGLAGRRARRVAVVAALPTAITWSLEVAGVVAFSNTARFIAALPLGFAAAWLVLGVLADD